MLYLTLILIAIFATQLACYGVVMHDNAMPRNIFQQRQYWSYFITGATIYFITDILTILTIRF